MRDFVKKEVAFERVVFFSDAIVAIAITLLALNLRLDVPTERHVTFSDLLTPWQVYIAFILSFINIAGFWRTHHNVFMYVNRMDDRMMILNTAWLFLIIVLPFTTTLVSAHFGETPVIFLYSLNIFALAILQNSIWDYADNRGFVDKEKLHPLARGRFRLIFNLDMLNSLVCVILSFFFPIVAFVFLFFKLPLFLIGSFYMVGRKRQKMQASKNIKQPPREE